MKENDFELMLFRITVPALVAILTVLTIRLREARSDVSDYARNYYTCKQELNKFKK